MAEKLTSSRCFLSLLFTAVTTRQANDDDDDHQQQNSHKNATSNKWQEEICTRNVIVFDETHCRHAAIKISHT